ncbi:tryptophan--tRNA ligase [Brevibacillus halotolerans]|uniref:tryptophan--tRNA ligase n=1 Tax=Brevibacillus halotolerans TaxID=1507437 RepID=UPI001B167E59|nr:tryptophan--tRNA ligase [Brevibacillus halotolerans]GIO00162.1 tryptophan--tRNA ligase [Brevibacillus halotolerans]
MKNQKLVSGIRSTGELHLGNYYGAMKGIEKLVNTYDANFFIADLHTLTTHPSREHMSKNALEAAASYLAAGLNPEHCTFYTQSSLAAEVAELSLYLGMVMPLGELMRCPTFKEKAKKHPDNVNYGLVGYPVLMTADILLHKGEVVPVGEDQLVHLEMARQIARRFNNMYGEVFAYPQPLAENAVRITALHGQGKMSKSDGVDTYISLQDEQSQIAQKVKKAYSDPTRIYLQQPGHPSVQGCNVYHLHTYFTDEQGQQQLREQCSTASIGCVACKQRLAEEIEQIVEPFRTRKQQLTEEQILDTLQQGAQSARLSAQKVLQEVRNAIGILMV